MIQAGDAATVALLPGNNSKSLLQQWLQKGNLVPPTRFGVMCFGDKIAILT
jgi:hypothetical protein